MPKQPPTRHPLPDDCRAMLNALLRCSFLPASWDKRFVRDLAQYIYHVAPEISEKQESALRDLAHKYRRQIGRQWPRPLELTLNLEKEPAP